RPAGSDPRPGARLLAALARRRARSRRCSRCRARRRGAGRGPAGAPLLRRAPAAALPADRSGRGSGADGRSRRCGRPSAVGRGPAPADLPRGRHGLRRRGGLVGVRDGDVRPRPRSDHHLPDAGGGCRALAYHFHEPLGVVGQIIPWNFPILMATWKLAPALAAGNAVVLKPAEQTPASILVLVGLIGDLLPDGVLNIVNGFGAEAGKPLASNPRIKTIAFTGETTTGRLIMQYASQNLIPVTLELGGKSPNIFFDDVAAHNDAFYDKALEGFAMFS